MSSPSFYILSTSLIRAFQTNQKFVSDMVYGILASRSCLLTDIADQLLETGKKINTVDRLSNHLMSGVPDELLTSYLRYAESFVSDDPTIFVDKSDVIKPNGKGFESLGLVRDGSRSTKDKNIYEKGYHVTEACALSRDNHPIRNIHPHSSSIRNPSFCIQTILIFNIFVKLSIAIHLVISRLIRF